MSRKKGSLNFLNKLTDKNGGDAVDKYIMFRALPILYNNNIIVKKIV